MFAFLLDFFNEKFFFQGKRELVVGCVLQLLLCHCYSQPISVQSNHYRFVNSVGTLLRYFSIKLQRRLDIVLCRQMQSYFNIMMLMMVLGGISNTGRRGKKNIIEQLSHKNIKIIFFGCLLFFCFCFLKTCWAILNYFYAFIVRLWNLARILNVGGVNINSFCI